jgi:hypothetical protein
MPSQPLFEKLEKGSRDDIENEINYHLGQLDSTIADFRKQYHALYAQLLIQQLAAREQRLQTKIMVVCTVIITILTAVITFWTVFK